jgi:hypothetical protein
MLTHVSSKLSIADDKRATDPDRIQTINFIIARKNATLIATIGAFFSRFLLKLVIIILFNFKNLS